MKHVKMIEISRWSYQEIQVATILTTATNIENDLRIQKVPTPKGSRVVSRPPSNLSVPVQEAHTRGKTLNKRVDPRSRPS